MIEIWGDVENWWHSDGVQHARKLFINQYTVNNETFDLLKNSLIKVSDKANRD